MSEKKTVQKLILMTKTEAQELEKKAKEVNMSVGAYIRLKVKERPNDYPEIRKLLGDTINEINHIGNNINQITKNNNSSLYLPEDKERLIAYMMRVSHRMDEVVRELGNM